MTRPDRVLWTPANGSSDFSRRSLLKLGGVALLGVGASSTLAACSGQGSAPAGNASSSNLTPKKGGVLRVGVTGGAQSDTLDAQNIVTNTDFARIPQLYDPLVTMDDKGQVTYRLAESIEPNADATVWTIKVRSGVVDHAGKPFGAKDVLFSLKRIVDKKYPGASSIGPINFTNSKVVDAQTVQVSFDKPYSIFKDALSIVYFFMVPEGYDPKTPIGTGPFKYKSFTPGVESTFERFDQYWESGFPYLDSVVITNVADETAQVNGLQSGQLDAIVYLSASSVASLTGSTAQVLATKTGSWGPLTMAVDAGPFTDVKVRQAMRLIVDREQMRKQVFGTYGSTGNDVFGIFDPLFDTEIPQRNQDLDQAKSLLKAAGKEGLTVDLVTSTFAPGMTQAAQVFATQAKAAGVTVNVKQQTTTDYFANSYLKVPFSQDYWPYQPYLVAVSQATLQHAPFSATHFNDPTYNSLFEQATAAVDVAKQKELVAEMLKIDYDQGGNIIPYFFPTIDAVAAKVQGITPAVTGQALGNWNFTKAWING